MRPTPLIEGVRHHPQCEADNYNRHREKQESCAYELKALPADQPDPPFAALIEVYLSPHNRLPSRNLV